MTTGQFEYGQAGQYAAIDDRRMITALAAGRSAGVVTPVVLTAGAGLNVVVSAGWLAVAGGGDGTLGVLGSGSSITVAGNPGDAGAARTDALWADVSTSTGQFTLSIMPQSAVAGRIGVQLATITVPANANLASAFTLAPAPASFGNFSQGVTVGPNSLWTLSATPDPYLKIAQGPFVAGASLPLYVSRTGVLTAANPADGTPEIWHPVGAAAGWATMGGYAAGIIYRMMPDGRVQFSGAASHAASASTIPINNTAPLAPAYRPQSIKVLADGNTPLARMAVEYRTDGILYAVNNSGTSTATQAIVDKTVSLYDTG
jgi:hypothetical protein